MIKLEHKRYVHKLEVLDSNNKPIVLNEEFGIFDTSSMVSTNNELGAELRILLGSSLTVVNHLDKKDIFTELCEKFTKLDVAKSTWTIERVLDQSLTIAYTISTHDALDYVCSLLAKAFGIKSVPGFDTEEDGWDWVIFTVIDGVESVYNTRTAIEWLSDQMVNIPLDQRMRLCTI